VYGTSNELDSSSLLEVGKDGFGSFPQFLIDNNATSFTENLVLPADFAVTQRTQNQGTLAFDYETQVHRRISDSGAQSVRKVPQDREVNLSEDISVQNAIVSNSGSNFDRPAAEKGELCDFPGCQRGPFSSESSRRYAAQSNFL
jgi:hypothetical protein